MGDIRKMRDRRDAAIAAIDKAIAAAEVKPATWRIGDGGSTAERWSSES